MVPRFVAKKRLEWMASSTKDRVSAVFACGTSRAVVMSVGSATTSGFGRDWPDFDAWRLDGVTRVTKF